MLRGDVSVVSEGKTLKLNLEDWVVDGSVIKTAEKSFAKIIFVDKSQMNIGPASEMKIEKFSNEDAGVIDLVKGSIRSQVTKDYLQIKDRDKSKLFIKTPNAVMGVRGTDFMISTNGHSTSTVLFEGEIVFNKLSEVRELSSTRLESIVDSGVRIFPGEFSVVEQSRPEPTIPSVLNIQQREILEKNEHFESDRSPQSTGEDVAKKSVVPEGLNGQVVSNKPDALKQEVVGTGSIENKTLPTSNAEGFVQGDKIKPANGSFVHMDSGIIIPPGPGAVLDKNTNSYIPSSEMGKVSADGTYVPPKNVEITSDGKILVSTKDASGANIVKEVAPPSPVVTATPVVQVGNSTAPAVNPALPPVVQNVFLNAQFAPNGLNDVKNTQTNAVSGAASQTEAVQNQMADRVRTTIQVNDTGATPP